MNDQRWTLLLVLAFVFMFALFLSVIVSLMVRRWAIA